MSAKSAETAFTREWHGKPAPRFLPLTTIAVRFLAPPHTDGSPVFGFVSNMSETGACVITNRSLPVDAKARLSLEGKGRRKLLEIDVRVVWCAERFEPAKEIVGFLTGVCFDPAAIDSTRRILETDAFQSIP